MSTPPGEGGESRAAADRAGEEQSSAERERAAERAREAYRKLLANRSGDDTEADGDDERILRERPPHW